MLTAHDLFELWTRLDAIERSARTGTLHEFLRQLEWSAAMLGPDLRAEVLRHLRAALRVELAFIVAHPEEAFSCLYNRLAWVHPRADVYYDLPAGKTAWSAPVVVAGAGAQLLREMLDAWRAAVEGRGSPWLRSLRPPEIGFELPLLEEYRADAPQHFRRLRLLDQDTRLELVYGPLELAPDSAPFTLEPWHCVAWDRATGRRVFDDVVQLLGRDVSPDGRYRVAHREWGQADLFERDAAAPQPLQCSDDRHVSTVAYSANGLFLAVAGYDVDSLGFVVVYDLKRCVPIMSIEVDTALFEVAISPTGASVAASGRETYVWEVATQREIYVLPVPHATLAFADDNRNLVTAQQGVVRVWSLDFTATVLRHYRGGVSSGAFSPDGGRLVTGSWLSAARTGEVIAHLDFHTGEYLEGGPPRNASVVGNRRVVRLEQSVHVWDARTGAALLCDRSRSYWHAHLIALHPEGTRYAVARKPHEGVPGDDRVLVLDTDSGAELAVLIGPQVTCMAWSPNGESLATGSIDGKVRLWRQGQAEGPRVVGQHEGRVADLAFVGDGSLLVSGADAEAVRVWRVDTGALVYARQLAEGDPKVTVWRREDAPRGHSHYTWHATAQALTEVNRALSTARRGPRWTLERRDGCLALMDERARTPITWFPANDEMIAHPDESIWAGGPVHVRLEGLA